jgi:membrane protease YdiL (CAAX protease family)
LALAILGILALSHALDLILSAAGIRETSVLARIEDLLAQASAAQLLEAALAMAVAPAVGEELLFRGLLLRRLCERLGPTSGLLLSSLLFGAIHLDLAQGAAAVVLGLYLGALTLRTGSIHAAIFCHGVNNLTAILGAIWKS